MAKTTVKFGYSVEINNVTRDFSQGLYANRIPMDDANILNSFRLWNELITNRSDNQTAIFSAIEMGGAQPQVDVLFLGKNFLTTMAKVREAAPNSPIRPLWRGANGFNLQPKSLEELEYILTQVAQTVAPQHRAAESIELLRVKAFDSQGIMKEVVSSVDMVKGLRDAGHPVTVEVAIPYSDGRGCDPLFPGVNPYPDDFYIEKFVEAARMAEHHGIPPEAFRVSLKDMAGELDAENATRLVRKIIHRLKDENINIKLGLHLHDTGLAAESYAAAIKVAKEEGWPIAIDTVEGNNTGFASTLEVDRILKEQYDIPEGLNLSEQQRKMLQEMAAFIDRAADDYKHRRVQVNLSGAELRQFKIPGGGLASFETAIRNKNIADRLGISHDEAVRLSGYALIAVGRLMGYPFAVTPGFQNKQNAALNLLDNMIKKDYLVSGHNFESLKERVIAELTDEQVTEFFLSGLDSANQKFLQGQMPCDLHPRVRAAFPVREGVLTDGIASELEDVIQEIDGDWIQCDEVDKSLAKAILADRGIKESASEYDEALFELANQIAANRAVAMGIILGKGHLQYRLERPWKKEPHVPAYSSREAFDRALKRYQDGLDPTPDLAEQLRIQLSEGADIEDVAKSLKVLLKQELEALEFDTMLHLKECLGHVIKQQQADHIQIHLDQMIASMVQYQIDQINRHNNRNGKRFLYSQDERITYALTILEKQLQSLVEKNKGQWNHDQYAEIVAKVLDSFHEHGIEAPYPGKILEVCLKESGQIQKGQKLFVIEAMKMQMTVYAQEDGLIERIKVKEGDLVSKDQVLLAYPKHQREEEQSPFNSLSIAVEHINDLEDRGVHQEYSPIMRKRQAEALEQTLAQKRGYNAPELSLTDYAKRGDNSVIHVVGNRGGCAAKIVGDLEQAGCDVRVLYTAGDLSTPVVRQAPEDKRIRIQNYTNQEEIVALLQSLAALHPDKTIVFHPGWGFLSEKDDFVAKIEELQEPRIIFAGPASEPMKTAGGKLTFRNLVQDVTPGFNPGYVSVEKITAAQLDGYIAAGFSRDHPIHIGCQNLFRRLERMGNDVVIKAVAGGGGRGIKFFRYDNNQQISDNYQNFVTILRDNIRTSEALFNDGEMLVEQCVRGHTHHIEVQFAATNGQAVTLGLRNCTAQNSNQKFAEINVIEGDYPQELIDSINEAAQKVADELARRGYQGLGTLEMLVNTETQKVTFLEVNTRTQVEHPVTEKTIGMLTGKNISLPLLNYFLTRNPQGSTPQDILRNVFGMSDADIENLNKLPHQRITHFRVNSKFIDLERGEAVPAYFRDPMWIGVEASRIAQKHGVTIIQGGLGKGNYDPQIGTIVGPELAVYNAARELLAMSRISQAADHAPQDRLNLYTSLHIYPLMFNENRTVRYDFTTKSVDDLLSAIKDGHVDLLRSGTMGQPGTAVIDQAKLSQALFGASVLQEPQGPKPQELGFAARLKEEAKQVRAGMVSVSS